MPCDKCKKRSCRLSANHWRALFFAMARSEVVNCDDYEPAYFRGLEGVYE